MEAILNALVGRPGLALLVEEGTLEEVRRAVQSGARSFVGHPATAALVGVPVHRGEYVPADGDCAYVLRLRRRSPVPGADLAAVGPEDLEVLRVRYVSLGRLHALATWGGPADAEAVLGRD